MVITKGSLNYYPRLHTTSLIYKKKRIKFEWKQKCEESFQLLKKLLTSAPNSYIANLEKDFVVCINACKHGIGGDLMQDGNVACHE